MTGLSEHDVVQSVAAAMAALGVLLAALRSRQGARAVHAWRRVPQSAAMAIVGAVVAAAIAPAVLSGDGEAVTWASAPGQTTNLAERDGLAAMAVFTSAPKQVGLTDEARPTAPLATAPAAAPVTAETGANVDDAADPVRARALERLRDFARRIDNKRTVIAALDAPQSAPDAAPSLPDVETMIERLQQRLVNSPDDIAGWKMLGWSQSSQGKSAEAAAAYQRALALRPDDDEAKTALANLTKAPLPVSGSAATASEVKP